MADTNPDLEEFTFDPEDVILLLLDANERLFGNKYLNGITRLEKLVFLLERETTFDMAGFFDFKAYNFGPFSKEVYEGIDFLENMDLLESNDRPYTSFYSTSGEAKLDQLISDSADDFSDSEVTEKLFSLTESGKMVAQKLRELKEKTHPSDLEQLESILKKYGKLSLHQIIKYVYSQYPEMAEESIHPIAKNR